MEVDNSKMINDSTGSRLREDITKLFNCFLIVNQNQENDKGSTIQYTYPTDFNDKELLHQAPLFCFPFKLNNSAMSSCFTFILTDIEGKHRFGFCKLVSGNKCYCFLSFLPWFEIFYKILNYVRELHLKNEDNLLSSILTDIYNKPYPILDSAFKLNKTLLFKVPNPNVLPSIPENRNLSEYYAAVSSAFMIDIFASLLIERRIIFTSSSLCKLTSCVLGAEALLHPLHWQHIFIPVMPPHLVDYCLAPMPFVIGIHSSLMPEVRSMLINDSDVVIADIDNQQIESNFDDTEHIPYEVISFLKSNLRKKNTVIGTGLAETFMKAQARLIGGYRNGLKFQPGQPIIFDEDVFIEFYKTNTAQEFARVLVQLQSFKQFVDGRLDMLNGGIGFRDDFENEVNDVNTWEFAERDVYKEWMQAAKKGGNEFLTQMKKKAKENMKVAKASLKALNTPQKPTSRASITSLDEKTQSIRPKRPPPISTNQKAEPRPPKPPRPPPPAKYKNSKRVVRRYSTLILDDPTNSDDNVVVEDKVAQRDGSRMRERTMSDPFQTVDVDLMSDMELAFQRVSTSTTPTPTKTDEFLVDLFADEPPENKSEERKRKSVGSIIRRSAPVNSRPNTIKFKEYDPSLDAITSSDDDILADFSFVEQPEVSRPSYSSSNDLAGLVLFDSHPSTIPISQPKPITASQPNTWETFDYIKNNKSSPNNKPDKKVKVLPVDFSMGSSLKETIPKYVSGLNNSSPVVKPNNPFGQTSNPSLTKPVSAYKPNLNTGQINSDLLLPTPPLKPIRSNNFASQSASNSLNCTSAYAPTAASYSKNFNLARDNQPMTRAYTVHTKPSVHQRFQELNHRNVARSGSVPNKQSVQGNGSSEMFSDLLNTWKNKEGI